MGSLNKTCFRYTGVFLSVVPKTCFPRGFGGATIFELFCCIGMVLTNLRCKEITSPLCISQDKGAGKLWSSNRFVVEQTNRKQRTTCQTKATNKTTPTTTKE